MASRLLGHLFTWINYTDFVLSNMMYVHSRPFEDEITPLLKHTGAGVQFLALFLLCWMKFAHSRFFRWRIVAKIQMVSKLSSPLICCMNHFVSSKILCFCSKYTYLYYRQSIFCYSSSNSLAWWFFLFWTVDFGFITWYKSILLRLSYHFWTREIWNESHPTYGTCRNSGRQVSIYLC